MTGGTDDRRRVGRSGDWQSDGDRRGEEVTIRQAVVGDAAGLAETYRSAYAENRELGFPAKAESATADQVADWIRDDWVFVAGDGGGDGGDARDDHGDASRDDEDAIGNHDRETNRGADRVVGGVRLQPTDDERVKLSRLAVHESWKGRGVGGRLLDRAERVVADRGYRVVWLTTPARHPSLPDWYARRGYEATGPYPLEYREYDEIVMERAVDGRDSEAE